MMRDIVLAVMMAWALVACAEPPQQGSCPAETTANVAGAVSITGASGSTSVTCPGNGAIVSKGCVANGGKVTDELVTGGFFVCAATVDEPVKGMQLILWAACQ